MAEQKQTMSDKKTKVLVLGASGMLGNAVLRLFAQSTGYEVVASARSTSALRLLPAELSDRLICGVDVEHIDSLTSLFAKARPDVVILSRPETFDRFGVIASYLQARNFVKVSELAAFTVWRPPTETGR